MKVDLEMIKLFNLMASSLLSESTLSTYKFIFEKEVIYIFVYITIFFILF